MEALGSAEALEPLILPQAMLRLIASDLSMLDPSSAEEHWMCLRQAVNATLKNAELDALDFGSDVANSHCYRGPSGPPGVRYEWAALKIGNGQLEIGSVQRSAPPILTNGGAKHQGRFGYNRGG